MLDSSILVTDVMSICNENTLREPKLNSKCIEIKWQLFATEVQAEMQTTVQYVPIMTLQITTEQVDVDSPSLDSLQIVTRKDDADFASLDLHIHGSKPKRDKDLRDANEILSFGKTHEIARLHPTTHTNGNCDWLKYQNHRQDISWLGLIATERSHRVHSPPQYR